MNPRTIAETKREEEAYWSQVFAEEQRRVDAGNSRPFSSYWWQDYYRSISDFVDKLFESQTTVSVLEAGCGSGKASILLGEKYETVLMDISWNALMFAGVLIRRFTRRRISPLLGDIFSIPIRPQSFDLSWGIGVIEHYEDEHIREIFGQMIDATKTGGWVGFGVPNFQSLPILKAKLLKLRWFKSIKGYRLGSERSIAVDKLILMFEGVARQHAVKVRACQTTAVGSALPMETPEIIVRAFETLLGRLARHYRFLNLVLFQIDR